MTRVIVLVLALLSSNVVVADVAADRDAFIGFYEKRFPDIPASAHIDGAYALDEMRREQWLEMEDFPPYEFTVDDGEALYNALFANGTGYEDCFGNGGAVKHRYPRIEAGEVVTLAVAINQCRSRNDEEPLTYDSEPMIALIAYMAYASRDQLIDINIAAEGDAAYEAGKQFYYSRRGQLNFSCSHCHMQIAGMKLRSETLSASYGHVTHWPTYRLKWQEAGSLHRRFAECSEQVGAEGLPPQSPAYKNLEYFLTVMSQGLPINGPASRK